MGRDTCTCIRWKGRLHARRQSSYKRGQKTHLYWHHYYRWKFLSCLTLCKPKDYSQPGSSVHRILQAGILEWVVIPFSRGSSWPRDWTWVFRMQVDSLPSEPPGKPMDAGNLFSCSSTFSKPSFYIWQFLVQILLKCSLKDFEHYFASMWNKCYCTAVWTFFGIAFLWKLTFFSPMATAEFSKFAGILSIAL